MKTCLSAADVSSDQNTNNHQHDPADDSESSPSTSLSPAQQQQVLLLSRLLRPPSVRQDPQASTMTATNHSHDGIQIVDRMSTTDLAYIGDVVYELFIRSHMIWPPQRTSQLQEKVVALVRAEYQAQILHCILNNNRNDSNNNNIDSSSATSSSRGNGTADDDVVVNSRGDRALFVLTVEELRVVSRGRNAVSGGSKRRRSDKTAAKAYQEATALEALIGYVYISNPGRCAQLLAYIQHEFLFQAQSSASSSVKESS
jgi:ribonuclease III family protein